MEARPWRDGKTVTYRYHPIGSKPLNLGTDRDAAIRRVLEINGDTDDRGSVRELWRLYQLDPAWTRLAKSTQGEYTDCAGPVLAVFGDMAPGQIRPTDVARYLRIERAAAPVRANREVALLSNLLNLAVERGEAEANPCKQVRRNPERPRSQAPDPAVLRAFLDWLGGQTPQRRIVAMAAEFAALAGSRQIEFRDLTWPQVDRAAGVIRIKRAKQRGGHRDVVEAVEISPDLSALLDRLQAVRRMDCLYVFPTRGGNAYTRRGFATIWQRSVLDAIDGGHLPAGARFTFHDLRAYYVTQYRERAGALPELHANPATTARVYDRRKEVRRRGL